MQFNTRIAPSPTGDMHLGTARTAYFNWLAARATQGRFLLRIDDTDQNRNQESVVKVIYDTMEWLGLDYDATFRQSSRFDVHKNEAQRLVDLGLAKVVENGAVALKIPQNMPTVWIDEIVGDIKITGQDMAAIDGMIILKSDGSPTYHFSSVLDDIHSDINLVIRGQDHVSNTPKHIAIYLTMQAAGVRLQLPKFAHVGLIHKDKKKMSKRDGAASMLFYRDNNYSPAALLNFMLRLGWSPSKDDATNTIISQKRAVGMFLNEGRMRASSANFDQAKLDFYNKKYKAATKEHVNV